MEVRLLSVGARGFFSSLRDSPSRLRRSILSLPTRKNTSGTQGMRMSNILTYQVRVALATSDVQSTLEIPATDEIHMEDRNHGLA